MKYCQQPEHRYATRYKTAGNYVLPNSKTNRGQCSIKFTGPKAWAKVPNEYKEIASQISPTGWYPANIRMSSLIEALFKRPTARSPPIRFCLSMHNQLINPLCCMNMTLYTF